MRLKTSGENPATFSSHVISDAIATVKLPNLGKGDKWKTKIIKIDGEEVTLQYNEARPTGVYFRYKGSLNYIKDRAVLENKTLAVVVKETKPKMTEEEKAEKKAARTAETARKRLTTYIEKNEIKETTTASTASSGRTKKIAELTGEEATTALETLKKQVADAKAEQKKKDAAAAAEAKPAPEKVKAAKAQPSTGAA